MFREYEIEKQASLYTDDADNYLEYSDDRGWTDKNDKEFVKKAFIEGAQWADIHPISPWNKYSEEKPEAREEELKKQASIYTDDADNYLEYSDDRGWTDKNDKEFVEKAFIEGAQWADIHPISPWNKYSEEKPEA